MGKAGVVTLVWLLGACGSRQREPVELPEPVAASPVAEPPGSELRVQVGTCFAWDARAVPAPAPGEASAPPPPIAGPPELVTRRPVRVPQVRPGGHRVAGALDPEIIRRVIRRALPRLRLCYEKQLARDPHLAGKVLTRFTISNTGSVASAKVTGLHPEVARCVERTLRAMRFPRPPGGGVVQVTYPFVFRPGDGAPDPSPPVATTQPLTEPPALGDELVDVCVAADVPDSLVAREEALNDCFPATYRHAERWTAVFTVDAQGAVAEVELRGLAPRRASACVRDEIGRVTFPASGAGDAKQRKVECSFVLENPSASAVVSRADEVRVTLSEVDFRGTPVADTYAVARQGSPAWYVVGLGSRIRARVGARLAIEAHPAVDAIVIERVTRTARAAGARHLGFARQVGTTGTWMVVNPLATPGWHCTDARAAVAIRLDSEQATISGLGANERIPSRNGEHDFARLRAELEKLRAAAPGARAHSDLDLSAAPGVEYRALLRALEVAVQAGYFDARLVPWVAPAAATGAE